MRGYYRKFVFTALLVVVLIPGIAGSAGAELVQVPLNGSDTAGDTGTVNSAGQAKSNSTEENVPTSTDTSAVTSKNTNTSEAHDSRTPAKKKGGLMDMVMKPMSSLSYVLPAALQAKLAAMSGPEFAAYLSSFVDPKQAVKIAQHMDPEFMAECIHYFEPAQGAALLEAAPNDMLLSVAGYLIKDKEYALMASFADQMSVERATSLFTQFNDADVMLKVAYHMKNTRLLADTVAALPQEYASRLIDDVANLGKTDPEAFKLMAHLSQRLPVDRILQMMETVAPSDVAIIVMHYPPELILKLLDRFDEYQLKLVMEKMSSQMTADKIGSLFRLSKPEDKVLQQLAETVFNTMNADQIMQLIDKTGPAYLGAVSLRCPPEMAKKVLKKMNDEQIKKFATQIGERVTPVQIAMMMEMARPEYIAAILPVCPPALIEAVLDKANPDHLASMALRFPPELGIQTLKKLDDAQARSLAAPIGKIWAVKQIKLSGADATYVAMILFNNPPEVVGVIKPKLNKAQLQELIKIAANKVKSGDQRAMKIFSQLVVR